MPYRRGATVLVTARLRPPDRLVEVADVRRVKDLLARLEVLPTTVLVIRDGALLTSEDELRDGDAVEVRFAISGGSGTAGRLGAPRRAGSGTAAPGRAAPRRAGSGRAAPRPGAPRPAGPGRSMSGEGGA
jgi:sulfur carrier protein ThiS